MSLLRALGFRRWDWRTCWREGDFWLCMATLLLPFGFVLLLVRWEPLRARIAKSTSAQIEPLTLRPHR